jgi:acyl-CoA dehydrogenase
MPPGLDRETLELTLDSLHEYAKLRLPRETLLELDARDEMPVDVVREMCGPKLGIALFFVPEAFGGIDAGAFDIYRLCEEMAKIDLGVATGLLATSLGSDPLRVGGTPEQQKLWLGRLAEEGLLMAYGATEPQAGSDLAALQTTAQPAEQEGCAGYRIQGRKQWISNGGVADVYTILARAPGGPSWFLVEAGTPGFGHERPEDKHGIRASNTAALTLDGVFVPADRLIGGVEGQGLVQAQAIFGYTRLMVAAFGLGAGWAALERAIPYSQERIQGGTPLSEKQGYVHKLIVPHAVRLEAARAYTEETARRLEEGESGLSTEGAIAKYLGTEFGNQAADAAIQALGGYGYTREYEVEKIRRDVRITTIYEGTSEIMEITIARDRWQLHLKTRGAHYHDRAAELEALHARQPSCGADGAALALHALAEALERARSARLTRSQHVLMRIGEWIAYAEGAASLARRAAAAARGELAAKAERRLAAEPLAAAARIFAREASQRVVGEAIRWLVGSDGVPAAEVSTFEQTLGGPAVRRAQAGLVADMDALADALYGRRPQGERPSL